MNKNKFFYILIITLGLISDLIAQPSFIWGKQFGTEHEDAGQDIVIYENGDFVLTGSTAGNLYSNNAGKRDGFIVKFDSLGNEIWKEQFGSVEDDKPWEIEKDKRGNIYIAGTTNGIINGKGHGNQDVLIRKYNSNGDLIVTKIIGTDSLDYLSEIYIDNELNIYLAGNTRGKLGQNNYGDWDYFIMKLDSNFTELYTYQFGTERWDYCNDFVLGKEGDFYIGGFTFGSLEESNKGETDAFIAHYSKNGELLKIKQFGTAQHDNIRNLIIDKTDNIYISGTSQGDIVNDNIGKSDAFLMKLNKEWNITWEKQFGTKSWDEVWKMEFINEENNILISGCHNPDAYIRSYDNQGNLIWNQVFSAKGIKNGTSGRQFQVFNDKYLYFTGYTHADLFSKNPNQNNGDIFIVKLGLKDE